MSAPLHTPAGAALDAAQIRERFAQARASGLRARDAAEHLGLAEGAALAAHAGVPGGPLQVQPLRGPWVELLQALEPCGPLMALTRNHSTVHEKTGVYAQVSATGPVGLALGEDIDLRLFFQRWHAGFAVTEAASDPARAPQHSLQFFDAHGNAVHKVFVREATDRAAWAAVVQRFAAPGAQTLFTPAPAATPPRPDADIDAAGLQEAWAAMQDTHEFFGLTRRFGVERQQSFRLVEGRFAWRLPPQAVAQLLQDAAASALPIMVFVGNAGCIQIHTGPVRTIRPLQSAQAAWINVLDAGFNLHLRTDRIAQVWWVEKPTADGVVTSVEAFDTDGELMAMFFGARKPGQPEREAWRMLVRALPAAADAMTAEVSA